MTDKFTIEQIEAAMKKGGLWPCSSDKVIAELTKPKWTPQKNEEVFCKGGIYAFYRGESLEGKDCRPLTPDEVPALKVAIEALESIAWSEGDEMPKAEEALTKIKELTGE